LNNEEKDYSQEGWNLAIWKEVFKLYKPYMKYLYILFFLNLMIALTNTALPLFNSYAVDNLTKAYDRKTIIIFGILYALVIIIETICHYVYFKVSGKAEAGFSHNLREKCFRKLQELSFSYYDKNSSGWLLSRMTSDITSLAEIISWSVAEFFWAIPLIVFASVIMFRTNVRLTIVVLLVLPVLAFITFYFEKNILQAYRKARKDNSALTSLYSEGINGAKTTKTLALEENNFIEFKRGSETLRNSSSKAAYLSAIYRPLTNFLSSFTLAMILYFGGIQAIAGEMSFGTLLLFTSYASSFFDPLEMIAYLMQDIQHAQANAERVVGLLNAVPAIVDSEEVIEKYGDIFNPKVENYEEIKGDIEFKDVTFSYNENEIILDHFNLKVKAGETIALVGETGSGKSTIINLLCRFYEPVSGQILVDGVDYRQRSLSWLHSKLGYVLQAPHLFSGTIKENIRFGKLDASDEDIIEAAKAVGAHEFISKLKEAYETEVGEGGSRLSTGQKQLICFARAILAKPAIFVLDEATSSIDTETEQIIQYTIDNIMKGHTSFLVAHRLSTIVNADRILLIDKGKIIEEGSHQQLMEKKGRYYDLYRIQYNENLLQSSFDLALGESND